jgi:hypothetical protein
MPPSVDTRPDFGSGLNGFKPPVFGTPDLRQGFQSNNPLPPSVAGQGLLDGGVTPDIRTSGLGISQALQQQPAQLAPDAASGPANLATSLGSIIEGIGGIPSQIGKGFDRVGKVSFMSEGGIEARAEQLFIDKIAAFEKASGTSIGQGGEDQRLLQQFSEEAKAEAKEAGDAANEEAFGFTVGMRAAQEAFNIAATHRAVKDQLNTIQNNTERFINGVEFNSKMQKNAQDLVAMKNNLRTIDSILQQTGPIQAGKQQQAFARNPVTGNLITEL